MRDFVDAILSAISTATLTDDEFEMITIEDQDYTAALYAEILAVIDSREAISNVRDRLGFYFQAKGVEITAPSAGSSNIYIGSDLCS